MDISFHKREKREEKTVKILGWNTLHFYPPNNQEIADFINIKNADIISLQEMYKEEVGLHSLFTSLINFRKDDRKSLNNDHLFLTNTDIKRFFPNYKYILTSQDKAILSKFPIEFISEEKLFHGFGYFIAKIKFESQEVYFINAHMPYKFNMTFGYEEKKTIFDKLYTDIENLKGKKIILEGDFNAAKSSYFIRKLFSILKEGLEENKTGFLHTWHNAFPIWRIDYFFHSKNIKCVRAEIFDPQNFSDHKGLITEIVID
ncbi:MAG: endonuclease/exonuclease/phosphatase family protein [bacterium]